MRRCNHDDINAVLGLWVLARSEHASTPDRREDIERLVEDSPAALLVAEAAGQIVGVVIAAWDGWRGNIYRLAVHAGYRLRSCGAHRVTALVAFDDRPAGSFWDAAGYPQDPDIGRRVRNI